MKRKKMILIVFMPVFLLIVGTGATLAMSSTNYNLLWSVLSGGGAEGRSSVNYILSDTVGQSSVISLSQSTNYQLGSGYWYGISSKECIPGDANEDGDINVFDLVKVKRIILGLDPPTCGADANEDGDINVFDLVKIKRLILGLD